MHMFAEKTVENEKFSIEKKKILQIEYSYDIILSASGKSERDKAPWSSG